MKTNKKLRAYILRGTTVALLFSCMIVALCWAINLSDQPPAAAVPASATLNNRRLSFADRVAYQRAIEDVYWRHRIWPKQCPDPKPSLDAVMSQAEIEKKVTDYLRNSRALEDYWQKPITADQLQTEMKRMAQHTKQPEVLRELFEALGNDSFVIAQCLARPVLAERLVRELKNEEKVAAIETRSLPRSLAAAHRGSTFYLADPSARLNLIAQTVQVLQRMRSNGQAFHRPYPVMDSPSGVECLDNTWRPTSITNAPTARNSHTAVWTGSDMIVWGGFDGTSVLNTGGRYNPITDSWTATSTTNAPSARNGHVAVWTGTEMIVWGGDDRTPARFDTGGRYNPSTDSWTATSTTNAPEARRAANAVWTGTEMIVWAGESQPFVVLNTGGKYDPSTDSWTATSTTNAPEARIGHRGVWSGSEMIVWGGFDGFGPSFDTGGRYNPITDSWTAMSTSNAPDGRRVHTAVWSGSEMIVWGGLDGVAPNYIYFDTGGRYDPDTDTWTSTSTINAPQARAGQIAVWTGSEMIVWGGSAFGVRFDTGGIYNPSTDSWTATSTMDAPSVRDFHTGVWSGREMIVWGGTDGAQNLGTGGDYCRTPPDPTPTPTPSPTATATATPTATASSTPRPAPTARPRPTVAPRP